MFPILHVTLCDYVIKESRNLILGFVSPHFNAQQHLVTICLLAKEIFCFSFITRPQSEWHLTSWMPLPKNMTKNCMTIFLQERSYTR